MVRVQVTVSGMAPINWVESVQTKSQEACDAGVTNGKGSEAMSAAGAINRGFIGRSLVQRTCFQLARRGERHNYVLSNIHTNPRTTSMLPPEVISLYCLTILALLVRHSSIHLPGQLEL